MRPKSARDVVSELVRRVPLEQRERVRGRAVDLLAAKRPASRHVPLPDDVADEHAVRELLTDTDIFGDNVAEANAYLNDALHRFRITLALVPDLPPGAKVLELGSNPYFFTRLLLRRGLDVTSANWFGEGIFGSKGTQLVRSPKAGTEHEFTFDHFNVEVERFPYADDSFDVVLFCEILEHLPHDPIHTLAEIHRVLRPNGILVLTTPNAIRWENAVRMQQGDNVYEQLSGYGTYGRHNREYTVSELRELLSECGYVVDDLFAADIHPEVEWPDLAPGTNVADRGDNLFAVARAVGDRRWRYPDWLYMSKHGLAKVVLPTEVIPGRNSDLQTGGVHPTENLGSKPSCWMGGEPSFLIRPSVGQWRVRLEGVGPPPEAGPAPIVFEVAHEGTNLATWTVAADSTEFVVEADLDADTDGDIRIQLRANRSWRPADISDSLDVRPLTAIFRRLTVEPR